MNDPTGIHEKYDDERLPPGQREPPDFPVLSKGETPSIPRDSTGEVWGAIETELTVSLGAFKTFDSETQRQDFHSVTGWSRFDCPYHGVTFLTLAKRVGGREDASHVLFHAHDGYVTDLPLSVCLFDVLLLAWKLDGEVLPAEHSGPLRAVTPHKYAYKGAKWLSGIEFVSEPKRGYWEQRGYSASANPWKEKRYV